MVGCDGKLVTLGRAPAAEDPDAGVLPEIPRIVNVRRRDELSTEGENDNPTLTADLLEIYFTSDRDGGPGDTDVWTARRASSEAPFDPPVLVEPVSTSEYETSAAVSADGRFLWVGSERDGGFGELDVWLSQRADRAADWSGAVHVPELSSEAKDIPRPPGLRGTIMPLASQRESVGTYRTYFAEGGAGRFAAPARVEELWVEERGTVDGFLSEDGRLFLFTLSVGQDDGDLYVARRESADAPFREPEALAGLNSDADERDPWLSADGKRFFFASDRDGELAIYEADVE